ncbi:MAG: hypothetical protein NDI69_15225 [Bacteriovoracaceae bacterium]|nr:hypothetical protein [Bacteriovoracaceae bacterium]
MDKNLRQLVFNPVSYSEWIRNSALTPTPFLLNDDTIRVYCGFRDDEGVSRIGFVDVSSQNPTTILKVSETPALDIGRDGCFDDNGVILGHIERRQSEVWMYYVGFQLTKKAKFLAFTGLAISKDSGTTFQRFSEAPILDRHHGGTTIRALHSVVKHGETWLGWFAQGDGWETINGRQFPQYNIWQADSKDGIHFKNPKLVIDNDYSKHEYRIGRPSTFDIHGQLYMFFTKGTTSGKDYFPGTAKLNQEGIWERDDSLFPLNLSKEGWDSTHLCYPRMIEVKEKYYLFYNGNNMGHDGFGVAEVTAWVQSKLKNIQT